MFYKVKGMGTLPQIRQFQKSDLVYEPLPSRQPGSWPKELWVMDYLQIAHVFCLAAAQTALFLGALLK